MGGVLALRGARERAFLADGDDGADLPERILAIGHLPSRKYDALGAEYIISAGSAIRLGFRQQHRPRRSTRPAPGGRSWERQISASPDWTGSSASTGTGCATYRTERAREMMKKHGLGAMLCMYDENVRYLTGTLTPGWNRLKPGLRYAHAVRRRRADPVRAGRPRLPDRAAFAVDPEGERPPLLRLDQRRGRSGLDPAGEQIHQGDAARR